MATGRPDVVNILQEEMNEIEGEIARLHLRKSIIADLLKAYGLSGRETTGQSATPASKSRKEPVARKEKDKSVAETAHNDQSEQVEKKVIEEPAQAAEEQGTEVPTTTSQVLTEGKTSGGPSTLEMARTILRNAAGDMLSGAEICDRIHTEYGIQPETLLETLTQRAMAGRSGFYMEGDKFGLTEFRAEISNVNSPAAA